MRGASGDLPRRQLGKTGVEVSAIAMGGIVVMNLSPTEADRMVRWAYDQGVTYYDVAPTYGNAEERLGPALKGLREKIFLACKTEKRDRQGAQQALEESLKRLRTDYLDLYQLHALTTLDDVAQAFGKDGAMETFLRAREKGVVRFLGFSAHSEDAALKALSHFPFDTVMFPVNFLSWTKGSFGPQVVKKAKEIGAAVIAIKPLAKTYWSQSSNGRPYAKCWYQPISEEPWAELALRFSLSLPISIAVPPGDENLFQMAVRLAKRFRPLDAEEESQLIQWAGDAVPVFPLKN
ncbi:MAG: aldo/keto reductase [Armatimonadetes bacterium]|nr:aldo/keto reductase [Armatimonadota bacterium]MDW8121096.1 aldo/keto reductase [Armatimonadota bacterium]